jgi:23S rRNA-intervening sequence protein
MPESVEKLEIWQDAVEIVRIVYELTKSWPREEMYGLTSQIRRAAVSIPANIAEGVGRAGPERWVALRRSLWVLFTSWTHFSTWELN